MFTWLTGRATATVAEPSVAHDDRPDDWPSTVPFRRRPRPLLRVIRWALPENRAILEEGTPGASGSSRPSDPALGHDHDLFVRQRVLREVRSQLMGSPEHESFGFLLGRLLYCPWTKTSFVLMDQAWQATGPLPTKDQTLAFREAWTSAWQAARRRRLQVIGWYHSHGLLGLQLSGRDMEVHRRYFPDPWQTALIVVPGGDEPLGGFIQRRSALFFAQSLVPFYEVLDADAVWRDDAKPSWVDWANYETEETIRVVAPSAKPARPRRRAEPAAETPPETEAASVAEEPVAPKEAREAVESPVAAPEAEIPADPAAAPAEPSADDAEVDADAEVEPEVPRKVTERSLEEEAEAFARAARPTQFYDPREGSVSLPWPMLPDLGDLPWRHQVPFRKHLPLPTRHARRPAAASAPLPDPATVTRGSDRSRFMEVVRAPAPYTAESTELALKAWQATSDPGLPLPDAHESPVAVDPVAEARASLLESGAPVLEMVERGARLPASRSVLPFWLEASAGPATSGEAAVETQHGAPAAAESVESPAAAAPLDGLRRLVSAYRKAQARLSRRERAEAERAARERAEARRVDRERAEAERAARERAEAERVDRERAEAERVARERAEAERVARERAEAERVDRERAEAERAARERAEAERVDRERAEAERLARGRRAPDTGTTAQLDSPREARGARPFALDGEPERRPEPGPPAVEEPDARAAAAETAAAETVSKAVVSAARRKRDEDDQYEYTVPVVMPSRQRFPVLAVVRRHLGKAAAIVLVGGAVAASMVLRGRVEPAPTPAYTAPPVSAELLDFSRSGEELSRRVAAYETARAQFDGGEIDCAGLASAQSGVSQAFVGLAEKFALIGARLPLRERLDYERLASSARQATGDFESAGCTQPQ